MSVNPYTLDSLYQKGIIDFVPPELYAPTPIGTGFQNPYMNLAKSGELYQTHNHGSDTFTSSYQNNGVYNSQIGSQAGNYSMYGGPSDIGCKSNNGIATMFGFDGSGEYNNWNRNSAAGVGTSSATSFEGTFGGFGDAKRGVANAIGKFNGLPSVLKGLIAAPILLFTVIGCFKFKKKPPKIKKQSFWSKLNPFKKPEPKKKPKLFAEKKSFWSKLFGKNK